MKNKHVRIDAKHVPVASLLNRWNRCVVRSTALISHSIVALTIRLGIASVFFQSGRTKVEDWLTVSDSAIALFRDEYKLPLLSAEVAAHLATYAEHALPILLAIGLLTRGAAMGLLAMTAVIQVFVYPSAWPTHLSWAGPLLYLVVSGAGEYSLDAALKIK